VTQGAGDLRCANTLASRHPFDEAEYSDKRRQQAAMKNQLGSGEIHVYVFPYRE
jgi:hypothetical protein